MTFFIYVRLDYRKLILDRNEKDEVRKSRLKTLYVNFTMIKKKYRPAYMHTTLSYSEFQPVFASIS